MKRRPNLPKITANDPLENHEQAHETQAEPADQNATGSASSFAPPRGPKGLVGERREGTDRREKPAQRDEAQMDEAQLKAEFEAEGGAGLDRRRGAGRRLSDFSRSAEEGDLNTEQFLFVMAIEAFKRENNRTFPQWTDVLEVIRLLGYRKTCKSDLKLRNADDFTERADAPANVRPKGWERRAA